MCKIIIHTDIPGLCEHLQTTFYTAKQRQRFNGYGGRQPRRHSRSNSGTGIHGVVTAALVPFQCAYYFFLETEAQLTGIGFHHLNLPVIFAIKGKPLQIAPASPANYSFKVCICAVADDGAVAGDGAHQVVELCFYRSEIRKYIRMVVFQVVQDGDLRAVVDEFGTLVKKSGVVLISFHNKIIRTLAG